MDRLLQIKKKHDFLILTLSYNIPSFVMSTAKKLFTPLILLIIPSLVWSQSNEDLRMKVVSLYQDVSLMSEQVGQLKLEMESLRRENQTLLKELEVTRKSQNQLVEGVNQFFENIEERIARTEGHVAKGNSAQDKKEIIREVTAQIDQLARRTQEAIDVIAKSLDEVRMGSANARRVSGGSSSYTVSSSPATFTDDYPKNGIPYEVKPGDTVSKIASKYNSKTSYIINANRLTNPNALQVGQTLFIPTAD